MVFLVITGLLLLCLAISSEAKIRMPGEWETHERTFMVWPHSPQIWGKKLLPEVRKDIAGIANAIVKFEDVVIFVGPDDVQSAEKELDPKVKVIQMDVDDLWARDTLPVFVTKSEGGNETVIGVDFNFNGWGNKQEHENDALVARKVLENYKVEREVSKIVGEGRSFETDGEGTLFVTKSSVVNENRNTKSQEEIETELKRVLGMEKVIWFDGVYGEDITDAHVDCLVRFVGPGKVILNRQFPGEPQDVWSNSSDQAMRTLKSSTDAKGRPFEIVELFEPNPDKIIIKGDEKSFLSSYVNFYVANGVVIVPEFGDPEADLNAQNILQKYFPKRCVVPVRVSALASGGGGIHCATHDMPAIGSQSDNLDRQSNCQSGAESHVTLVNTSPLLALGMYPLFR